MITIEIKNNQDYICRWKLKNEKGETRIESFSCDDLEDFGRICGNVTDALVWVTLRQKGQAII